MPITLNPDHYTYRYYAIADIKPIRVWVDKLGSYRTAEVPARETGQLYHNAVMLGRILASEEVEEIDQEKFERLCQAVRQRAQKAPALGH